MYKNIVFSVFQLRIFVILIALTACQDSTDEYSCNNIIKLEEQGAAEDSKAIFTLAQCYRNGEGVTKDLNKAVEYYQKAADKNDASAQYNLGVLYNNGDGVTKDLVKAVEYYQKAADQNYARAQVNLGMMYQYGDGVIKDLVKAVEYYQKAADQNYARAQVNLGVMYQYGDGVIKDLVKAVEYYQKAADQNYARAQVNLGVMYQYGQGVTKDLVKAVEYYQKAADQNYARAQYNLGVMYKYGNGVTKDLVKTVEYYQKAADQNYASAQNDLGVMYYYGEGVQKDLIKATEYYQKAADQGNKLAIDNLKSNGGVAEPFGCKLAISDFNQISNLYTLKEVGTNEWNGGQMYNIHPISQVDFSGIKEIRLIFDKNKILHSVVAYFEKNKFNNILKSLEVKYRLISKNIPQVGNSSAKLFAANCDITLESLHLEKFLTLSFTSSEFKEIYNRKSQDKRILKRQKEESML